MKVLEFNCKIDKGKWLGKLERDLNPALHGFKKVAVYIGLENDSRNHFRGQIDFWPKKYVKLGLEVVKNKLKCEGVPKNFKEYFDPLNWCRNFF